MRIILLLFLLLFRGIACGQPGEGEEFRGSAAGQPLIGVKTDFLRDAALAVSLGAEVGLSGRYTLDIPVSYNAWDRSDTKRWRHLVVQPELRWWFCESFYGHFLGIHGIYGQFNAGGVRLPFGLIPDMKAYRYQGDLYGAGLSWGYQWLLSPRLSLEVTVGAGYVRLDYEKYECGTCGKKIGEKDNHYFGPTKAGVSLIYFIK